MSDKILVATEENGALALRRKEPLEIESLNDAIQIAAKTVVTDSSAELLAETGETEQVPYNFRASGGGADIGDRETDMIVGGTVAWNQLINNGNFSGTTYWSVTRGTIAALDNVLTFTCSATVSSSSRISQNSGIPKLVGHKILFSVYVNPSVTTNISFGSTQATVGIYNVPAVSASANAWTHVIQIGSVGEGNTTDALHLYVNRYSTLSENDTVQIKNMTAFDLTQMFGATIADYVYSLEQANAGDGVAWFKKLFPNDYYAYDAGTLRSVQTSAHRMIGFNAYDNATGTAQLIGGMQYQITGTYTALSYSTGETIAPDVDGYFTPTSNGTLTVTGGNGTTTCIHLVWDGEKDGTYEPYVEHTYTLDDSLTLRGVPTLDANNKLRYDGDTYASDGTVTRRFASVDMGTLTLKFNSTDSVYAPITDRKSGSQLGVCTGLTQVPENTGVGYMAYGEYKLSGTSNSVVVKVEGITVSNANEKLSGIYLIYELATPTTESADPYTNPQIVDDFGTEEYVDAGVEAGARDVAIPVGHETFYHEPLRKKIENLPKDFSTLIAETEKAMTATRNYVAGEFLIVNNQLYKVTANIANGGTITPGTNVTVTTICEQLVAIFAALNN